MTKNLLICALVLVNAFFAVGANGRIAMPTVPATVAPTSGPVAAETYIPSSFDIEISPLPAPADAAAEAQRFEH